MLSEADKVLSSQVLATFRPEPWYFATSVRKAQFQYSYPREKDPTKAQVFIAPYRAQSLEEFGLHFRYSKSTGKYIITSLNDSSRAQTQDGFSRLLIKFYLKSKLNQKKILLEDMILDHYALNSVGKMNYHGFTCLKHLRLSEEILPGLSEPVYWIRKLKFIAVIKAVIEKVTPHLGLNKMDISKHITWEGGYWIYFDGQKFDAAMQKTIAAPAIIHKTRFAQLQQSGQMQRTGDDSIDASWNLFGVKYERLEDGRVRGWFPFMDCSVKDVDAEYSPLKSLKGFYKALEDEKAAGRSGEGFETVLGHSKRAVKLCDETPNGAMVRMNYNTCGAAMGRIPGDLWNYNEWDAIKFEFSAKEGVHQRETESAEALAGEKLEWSINEVSAYIKAVADLQLAAPKTELFRTQEGHYRLFWFCSSSKWLAYLSPVGEKSFSVTLFVPESHILDILRAK
eukprot:TRINITY_DN342_c0_g1_i1.p1 TRINITY_DN342_c0_g1~~TRINITY_DN342_c0_g1_i1.p1  ORF type:complete len:452 (+),score=85.79 TRINITY_DN342_c0_g1_i1:712-2067(+)